MNADCDGHAAWKPTQRMKIGRSTEMTERKNPAGEHYLLIPTPFGDCGIAWSRSGLTRVQLPEVAPRSTERSLAVGNRRPWSGPLPDPIGQAVMELRRYFDGTPTDLMSVVVDLDDLPPFHVEVYAKARLIPWGETRSYGELARSLGVPGAARAIGQAMGRNPVPIVVPCHRVLAHGSGLGGFSAPGGRATKQRLLELERANAIEHLPLFAPRD